MKIVKCAVCQSDSITCFCPSCQIQTSYSKRKNKCEECGKFSSKDENVHKECYSCPHDMCVICGNSVSHITHLFCLECYKTRTFIRTNDNKNEYIGFYVSESEEFNSDTNSDSSEISQINTETDTQIDSRKKYPANIRCNDGHYVRSRGEKIIDDWLFDNKFFHIYEKLIYDADNDQEIKPDFYLSDHCIYIEFWGKNESWYAEIRELKEKYYNANNITYISIEINEIDNIGDILQKRLAKYLKRK